MDKSSNEKVFSVDGTIVVVQKRLAPLLTPAWEQPSFFARLLVLFAPVNGRGVSKVEAWPFMPLFAASAFPLQSGQIMKRNRRAGIANPRTLVTARTKQRDSCQLFGFFVPSAVSRPNNFAVVAPCTGKRIFSRRPIAVKSQ